MKHKRKIYLSIVFLGIIILFSGTYYLTSKSIKNRELEKQNSMQVEEVNSSSIAKGRTLRDDLIISFYTNEKRDKTTTVKELIKINNLKDGLTEELLTKQALKDGYELVEKSNDRFIYRRNSQDKVSSDFEKDTYYIGESDGYLAIYKADNNGELKKEKVYSDEMSIDMFRDTDAEKIKNFKYFSSKNIEEVENKIMELIT
ncbi:hypothetical protein [Clostridium sp.]|uniref:hypothetical protein n=1 Tax=Clostridium sp. TaxID=1506 RepID=UPI0026DD5867|nr:hypothetical protein [Clostridium sp.]MDO5038809.1 hypothetical protein [Clostridium sp.]